MAAAVVGIVSMSGSSRMASLKSAMALSYSFLSAQAMPAVAVGVGSVGFEPDGLGVVRDGLSYPCSDPSRDARSVQAWRCRGSSRMASV